MMLSVFNCCVSVIGCCGKCCSCCVVVFLSIVRARVEYKRRNIRSGEA